VGRKTGGLVGKLAEYVDVEALDGPRIKGDLALGELTRDIRLNGTQNKLRKIFVKGSGIDANSTRRLLT